MDSSNNENNSHQSQRSRQHTARTGCPLRHTRRSRTPPPPSPPPPHCGLVPQPTTPRRRTPRARHQHPSAILDLEIASGQDAPVLVPNSCFTSPTFPILSAADGTPSRPHNDLAVTDMLKFPPYQGSAAPENMTSRSWEKRKKWPNVLKWGALRHLGQHQKALLQS